MLTFEKVIELIEQAKKDATTLELALKVAQVKGHGPGKAHEVLIPTAAFNPVLLSDDLKVHLQRFNATMKALQSIRNDGLGDGT